MVIMRQKLFRTMSVPVDNDEPINLPDSVYESHRRRMISNAALDNSDALSAASRRNDQQIMKEVNDRLANAVLSSKPSPVLKRRSSVHHASPVRKPSLPTSSVSIVTSSSEVDSDVNHEVDLMMPATSRLLRAGSVPRSSKSSSNTAAAILAEYNNTPVIGIKTKMIKNGTTVLPLNESVRYSPEKTISSIRYSVEQKPDNYFSHPPNSGSLTPSAAFAVRQAQRDLDRIDQELKTDTTFTPRASPVRTVRTYTTGDIRPILRRSSSHHGSSNGTRVRSPSPSYSSLIDTALPYSNYMYTSSAAPLVHTRTYSYPAPRSVTVKKLVTDDLDYVPISSRVPLALTYTSSTVPSLSSITPDIEALIRSARTLPEVTATKSYIRPSPVTSYVPYVASYSPSAATSSLSSGLPPIPKPQVSTTRRHVREVLCKVKKDPHYFD